MGCFDKDPSSQGLPDCVHSWNWSDEIITTAPAQQHRRCTSCGRRECISICRDQVPLEDCKDAACKYHVWFRELVAEPDVEPPAHTGTSAYEFQRGILVPRR